MSHLKIITTSDGSHSLWHAGLDETYHSIHGAVQESTHVFIRHGLQHWLNKTAQRNVVIFEVGFGTGLNAWLAHQLCIAQNIQAVYYTIEAFPLPRETWSVLNYAQHNMFCALNEAPWNIAHRVDDLFTIHKMCAKLEDLHRLPEQTDVVFFDAFAPGKQPELWTFKMLEKVCSGLSGTGVFVTYCAKGQLKRDLKALGLTTETLPGPPGKKEMVRASADKY